MPRSKLAIVPRGAPRPAPVPNNLPAESAPLIGRAQEAKAALQLLAAPAMRLLTLVGPGGVGKTRLALWLAAEMLDYFEGGVYFVELATISAADRIVPAIASTLQVRETSNAPLLTALQAALQKERMLLLLDNIEQIGGAGRIVSTLLAACPALTLLVTGRTVLGLADEQQFALAPLAIPDRTRQLSSVELLDYGAVALFVQRAQLVDTEFELNTANAAAIVEICRRVDGLPLAIELVAAHTRLLSPKSILERMTHPLRLLTQGPNSASGRQRTMRDTIEWSYRLLDAAHQRLLGRLAVFAGGFAPRLAEAVCNDNGDIGIAIDHPLAIAVLDGLEVLVNNNLLNRLQRQGSGDRRLMLLETVREYAWEQLLASGEAELVQRRHADYYLRLAERAEEGVPPAQLTLWLEQLDWEQDNLRAALLWLLQRGQPAAAADALRLVVFLQAYWERRTHLSEIDSWLRQALDGADHSATPFRARALRMASRVAQRRTDFGQARIWAEAALTIGRELDDGLEIAASLDALGGVALMTGDHAKAGSLSESALAIYRDLGMSSRIPFVLNNLGLVASHQGDYRRAENFYQESIRLFQEQGEDLTALTALTNLGFVIYQRGDAGRARAVLLQALHVALESDNSRSAGRILTGLGGAILAEVAGSGQSDIDRQIAIQAVTLLGASAALRARGGGHLDPLGQAGFDRNVAHARSLLGAVAFDAAWQQGQAMNIAAALQLAGQKYERPTEPAHPRRSKAAKGGLTAREYEVADFVSSGLSNAEIARSLVLSERTVEMHVSNALRKLGLTTRTQLAAWIIERSPDDPNRS